LASALRILERFPGTSLTLLEKENAPGQHQTGNNSGVLHCGLAYRPGSAKARLAVRGIRQMVEFCAENGVPHEICGKLVVASRPDQVPRLQDLYDRGTRNGLRGLRLLASEEIPEIEPHAAGAGALHVPEEGIVDYRAVCEALAHQIRRLGGEVICRAEVRELVRREGLWFAESTAGRFSAEALVTCAGLQADRIARLAGEHPATAIVPFRGDYYKLVPEREFLVRNLIYPVADPQFPFLGVHFTRMIRGGIEAGPNAVLSFHREGYSRTSFRFEDACHALAFPGLWKFLRQHAGMCAYELRRAFSRRLFAEALRQLVPEVREEDLVPAGAGIRAQAMRPNGTLVEDFEFLIRPATVHVLNAPSPAATACLAIGETVAEALGKSLN
jgi:L-2-hydroxyglutarate oxidase LhgO